MGSYHQIIEKEPLGRELCHQFCKQSNWSQLVEFLHSSEEYETSIDTEKPNLAKQMVCRYLEIEDRESLFKDIIGDNLIEDTHRRSVTLPTHALFAPCVKEVRRHLQEEPFTSYKKSVYFKRYLQWKYLERRPVTKHLFRHYRVLGKGGFGEVCACQ